MELFRFRYSPYARKVQMLLDLLGRPYAIREVPYGDRGEIAEASGGYVQVPVLIDDEQRVVFGSREICEHLLTGSAAAQLVPPPLEGPIWAYADFVDGPLEDILFRIASPDIRDAWPSAADRGLYVFIKEHKFGPGCVDNWLAERPQLIARAQHLLAPTLRTLSRCPFLFGDEPTLADAALYGNCAMLDEASSLLLPAVSETLVAYARRLEGICRRS